MFLSPNTHKNSVRSQSPSRVQNYQSPTLPKTARRLLKEPNHTSVSTEFQAVSLESTSVNHLNITCINCQDLIPLDKIETHSMVCTCIQADIQRLEQGSYLNEILYKLNKLEDCLVAQNDVIVGANDQNYLKILLRFCQTCKFGSFSVVQSTLQSLSALISNFRGTLSVRIYADRLQNLLIELKTLLEQTEIENKKQELQKIRNEVEKYKTRTEIIQKTIVKTSSVDRLRKIRKKIGEISAINCSGETDVPNSNKAEEEVTQEFNYRELQKHFFSLCLGIKMKLPKKLRVKNFSIQELFLKAVDRKIAPDDWASFISEELNNNAKTERRQVNRSFASFRFEVILEEPY